MCDRLGSGLNPGAPYGSAGIANTAARTSLKAIATVEHQTVYGQNMEDRLPENGMLEKILTWQEQHYIPPDIPQGVPGQEEVWKQQAADATGVIVNAVREAVAAIENISGRTPVVLGDEGTLDERAEEFRRCVHDKQPVVSVAISGSMRRWLSVHDTDAMSLHIYTHMPEQPLHTALVTRTAAMLSDCSGAWRVPRSGEPLAMSGEPLVPHPDPQFAIFPSALEEHAAGLRKYYKTPIFPRDTSAAIARAMLDGATPVAVHVPEHVLNSAIVPVAIAHGLVGRLQKTGTLMEKPHQATEYLFQALMGDVEFGEGLVIAREMWDERRVRRILSRILHPDDTDPYDDELDEYDGYGLDDDL
ncbi:hypothetical protein [Streptomyces sp. NPDC059215]|uniref:hypothetical protein n=1 Tax=Streptomyces sp. NPDC059215 TaxID=3346772 RepID=UPI0036803484